MKSEIVDKMELAAEVKQLVEQGMCHDGMGNYSLIMS